MIYLCSEIKGRTGTNTIIFTAMTQYHLHLKGFVGGADFSADAVQAVLSANPDAEVSVLVDSTGGQLATALSISSAFRRHGKVHVHFAGMNASAATIASLGAARITMDASALYLVHKCSMGVFEWASMNADQLQEYIKGLAKQKMDLDTLDSDVAAMYAAKCKKPQEELLQLMAKGGWMTSQEALEWGFVDEVTAYEEDSKPTMTKALAAAMADAAMPIPAVPYTEERPEGEEGGQAAASEPLFTRFMAAIASLFRSHEEKTAAGAAGNGNKEKGTHTVSQTLNTQTIMTPYKNIEAALKVEGFQANEEGAVTLTAAQMKALDEVLADNAGKLTAAQQQATQLQTQVDTLTAENEALKAGPADTTVSVVNGKQTGGQNAEKEPQDAYLDTLASAKALMELVS